MTNYTEQMGVGHCAEIAARNKWLFRNQPVNDIGIDAHIEFVDSYYGVKPLWKTEYSQGIVVKAENDSDYFIVMECSDKNKGYKQTKVILTPGGCM